MKHLFFVAVASGIFSGTTLLSYAQTNAGAAGIQPKVALKFIESIEILPVASSDVMEVSGEKSVYAAGTASIKSTHAKSGFASNIEACSSLQFKYAMMTEREVESITNFSLYKFIDEWWASPYQYGGTDSNGIDCSAFTGKLLSSVYGINIPRTAKDQYKSCEKVNTGDLSEGDLVFFNTRGGISHVGLYLGNNYFVHSSVHDGITISNLTDEYYSKRFISGGRVSQPSSTVFKIKASEDPILPPSL